MIDAIHNYLSTERNPAFLPNAETKQNTCSSFLYICIWLFEELTLRKVNGMVHVYVKAAWIESRSGTAGSQKSNLTYCRYDAVKSEPPLTVDFPD